MKTVFAVILLSALAYADGIPITQTGGILVNEAGGTNNLILRGSNLFGSGPGYEFQFSGLAAPGQGMFTTGWLIMSCPEYTLEGQMSGIYLNLKTGLLQGHFVGQQRFTTPDNHYVFHIYHATFYEHMDLKNHTNTLGEVIYSTAPEPEAYVLFVTGLLGMAPWVKRKLFV